MTYLLRNFRIAAFAVALAAALLTACGDGGDSGTSAETSTEQTTAQKLTGTAATGAPLANAVVTLRGADGAVLTTVADAGGKYAFADVSKVPLPFSLSATAGGTRLATLVVSKGTETVANITPLSQWVAVAATGASVDAFVADPKAYASLDAAKLKAANARVSDWMTRLNPAMSKLVWSVADLVSTPFDAVAGNVYDGLLGEVKATMKALNLSDENIQALAKQEADTAVPAVNLMCDIGGEYEGTYTSAENPDFSGKWTASVNPQSGKTAMTAMNTSVTYGGSTFASIGTAVRIGVGDERAHAEMDATLMGPPIKFVGKVYSNGTMSGVWEQEQPKIVGAFTGVLKARAKGC